MNLLLSELMDNALNIHPVDTQSIPRFRELEKVKETLTKKMTAAMGSEFAERVWQAADELRDLECRCSYQQGLCLGGQLVMALLNTSFDSYLP